MSTLSIGHFWGVVNYSVVGFGEEFAFRGFLQTRLIAWLGRWQGWLAASVLMALAHVVQRITIMGMVGVEAWLSSAALIPISLLMGYVMLRTENIVAPGLFHTFADWVGTLPLLIHTQTGMDFNRIAQIAFLIRVGEGVVSAIGWGLVIAAVFAGRR